MRIENALHIYSVCVYDTYSNTYLVSLRMYVAKSQDFVIYNSLPDPQLPVYSVWWKCRSSQTLEQSDATFLKIICD